MDHHSIAHFFYSHTFLSIGFSSSIIVLIVLALVLLAMLAFINGAEVALFSLTYKDITMLKTKKHSSAKRIVNFLENPKGLLGSITIAASILTIAIIIILNYIVDYFFPEGNLVLLFLIKLAVIGALLVFIGNIFPKVWASQSSLRFAYYTSFIVEIIFLLFGNISKPLIQVSDSLDSRFAPEDKSKMDGELLDYAIDKLPDEEATKEEKLILKGIRKFGDTTVKQIMRPRLDVNGVEFSALFEDVVKRAAELHYSRLPVYEKTLDDVKGLLYTKDLLPHLGKENFNWQSLLRTPVFVHEQKLIVDLLQEFKNDKIHIAVVVDEFGGTSGIVTLEDIVEEIVGDIRDEFDDEEVDNNVIDENNFTFDGKTMLNDACKKMGIPSQTFDSVKGESDSIGGLVLELAEEIPAAGQEISSGDFLFTVKEVEKNRVKRVTVKINR